MAQQLKRWESPRRKGRNHKGRGGSAKQRQYMKRQKLLRKRLQAGIDGPAAGNAKTRNNVKKGEASEPLFFYGLSTSKALSQGLSVVVRGASPQALVQPRVANYCP